MFQVNREMTNPRFIGYKLSSACEEHLEYKFNESLYVVDSTSTQFQVLADQTLRNHLYPVENGCFRVILSDGSVRQVNKSEDRVIGKVDIEEGVQATIAGPYISIGKIVYRDFSLYPVNLKHDSSLYLLHYDYKVDILIGYQVLARESLFSETIKQPFSVFLISIIRNGQVIADYASWSRPLMATVLDGAVILASATGVLPLGTFVFDSSEVEEAEVVQERNDDSDEGTSSSNDAIIGSFSLDDPSNILATSPLLSLLTCREGVLIGIQHGVDMLVLQILNSKLETSHLYTISAFAYIQAGKERKKYLTFDRGAALLAETNGSIYLYRNERIEDDTAKQFLVSLDEHNIYGVHLVYPNELVLLTKDMVKFIKLEYESSKA